MDEECFWKLHDLLRPYLTKRKRKRGATPNCDVGSEMKLSIAFRFFAGGDPLDLMISHGVSMTVVYSSVWAVVD